MNYLEILKFRHACKIFDESKKISAGEFDFILEAGRLSPSSTGLEQWDFLVVQNKELRRRSKPFRGTKCKSPLARIWLSS